MLYLATLIDTNLISRHCINILCSNFRIFYRCSKTIKHLLYCYWFFSSSWGHIFLFGSFISQKYGISCYKNLFNLSLLMSLFILSYLWVYLECDNRVYGITNSKGNFRNIIYNDGKIMFKATKGQQLFL